MTLRARSVALAVVVAASLAGCGESARPPADPTTTATATATSPSTASDGRVEVEITQGRSDYASGRIAVRVHALTDRVAVLSFSLTSAAFESPAHWDDGTVVPSGAERDVRFDPPPFACPVGDTATEIVLEYESAGEPYTARVSPDDPFGVIPRLAERACLADAVAAVVDLRLSDDLTVTGSGPSSTAEIELIVTPSAENTNTETRVVVDDVEPTTLLAPAGGGATWPIGSEVHTNDEPTTIPLVVVPARCDAHAIAEDKVGTILRVRVDLEPGIDGVVEVPASDALRAALYDFVAAHCGE